MASCLIVYLLVLLFHDAGGADVGTGADEGAANGEAGVGAAPETGRSLVGDETAGSARLHDLAAEAESSETETEPRPAAIARAIAVASPARRTSARTRGARDAPTTTKRRQNSPRLGFVAQLRGAPEP